MASARSENATITSLGWIWASPNDRIPGVSITHPESLNGSATDCVEVCRPLPTSVTTGPLFAINVPAGLPPGTEVHVVATVPAKYAGPNSPELTAELTFTTT